MRAVAAFLLVAGLACAPVLAATGDGARRGSCDTADPDATLKAADEAFDNDDYDHALRLYQSVLAARPDDLQALRRSGLLLGWAGRPKEAIPPLQKAVRLDPSDRVTRRQLARVESWAEEYAPSLEIYDALVHEDSADLTTAVERASVLSWANRLSEAEQAYRDVLATDPQNADAKAGLAQTLGWQGRYAEAEALYHEVEAKNPSAARIGLGRLALLQGDPQAGLAAAREELARNPKSQDAKRLEKEALAKLRPSLGVGMDLLDDTDDNRNLTTWATGSFHPAGRFDLDITAAWMRQEGRDLEAQRLDGVRVLPDANGDGTADVLHTDDDILDLDDFWVGATVGLRAGKKGRLALAAAVESLGSFDRPEPLDARGDTTAVSGSAQYRLSTEPVGFAAGLYREIPKWTAYITEKDLRWDSLRFEVFGKLPWRIGWSVSGDTGTISGGVADNDRVSTFVRFWRPFETGPVTLTPRYTFRYLAYDLNLNDGYFDPQHYTSNLGGLEASGHFGGSRWEWGVSVDIGFESFRNDDEDEAVCDVLPEPARGNCVDRTGSRAAGNILFGSGESDRNTVETFLGRMAWNVTDRISLEAYAAHTDSAAQSATGFKSRAAGVAARFRF